MQVRQQRAAILPRIDNFPGRISGSCLHLHCESAAVRAQGPQQVRTPPRKPVLVPCAHSLALCLFPSHMPTRICASPSTASLLRAAVALGRPLPAHSAPSPGNTDTSRDACTHRSGVPAAYHPRRSTPARILSAPSPSCATTPARRPGSDATQEKQPERKSPGV